MNIVFVVPGMSFGGAERVISILANKLVDRGHQVNIGVFNIEAQNCLYELDNRVKLDFIKSFRFHPVSNMKKSLSNLENYFSTVHPSVVISFTNVVASQCSIVCKKNNIPMIFSERNDPKKLLHGIKNNIFQHVLVHNVQNMVFQTRGAMNMYPHRVQAQSEIILNPLELQNLSSIRKGERENLIVSVGRLAPQKRHDILIKAFAKISDKYPDYILKIYGEGSLREADENLISSLHLEDRIILMGTSKDILAQICNATLFAFTSDYEGLPNALIEAMALGLPCVSTKCSPGGAEELIQDGINGRLVDCNDHEEFAQTMDEMLSNYETSKKMGIEAMKIRERVDVEYIVDKWEAFIEKVIMVGDKE